MYTDHQQLTGHMLQKEEITNASETGNNKKAPQKIAAPMVY
jgi:hypothetical protein